MKSTETASIELSKRVWKLNDSNRPDNIKWNIKYSRLSHTQVLEEDFRPLLGCLCFADKLQINHSSKTRTAAKQTFGINFQTFYKKYCVDVTLSFFVSFCRFFISKHKTPAFFGVF